VEHLKVKVSHFYETSRTTCPARQRHIQEEFNPPLHLRENLKTYMIFTDVPKTTWSFEKWVII